MPEEERPTKLEVIVGYNLQDFYEFCQENANDTDLGEHLRKIVNKLVNNG